MDSITCMNCGSVKDKAQAEAAGWLVMRKTFGPPGSLFVMCANCLSLSKSTATRDVIDDAPFREVAKEVRRERAIHGYN